ncbi:MAG: magnesium transporter CorA family protein [Candidatus Bipolaricaulota bacterium]|nr:magnesium transporter CorA family protein [Candidatus Bipolaricaulota bacterium]
MLQYTRNENGRLVSTDSFDEAEIVRVVNPTSVELSVLAETACVPMDFLTAATDRDERPRFEVEEDCKLLILRVPHHEAASDTPYVTVALAIILTPTRIVTVCAEDTALWSELLSGRTRIPPTSDTVPFLCTLFLQTARQYLGFLNSIRHESDEAERAIQVSMKNQTLIRMQNLQKCLVYFTTSLRANEPMWDRVRRLAGRNLTDDEIDMLEDVRVEFGQARDLADIYSNILTGTMDAFASIISNNVSSAMKLLATITIVLMLPTLVASTFGMNVQLPFQESPFAFWITMGLSIVLSIVAVIAFLRMKIF